MEAAFTPELIVKAYTMGVFPMGGDDGIRWYSPDPRCVIDLDDFHASDRLMRKYRQNVFEMRVNSAWPEVLNECARRETTWITEEIFAAYTKMHQMGLAHSVEAYLDGELAGGLYGVALGGAFMGESMFHRKTDASKVSLVYLIERLKERGFILLDCQYMTDHLRRFNAKLISRQDYLVRLKDALRLNSRFD